MKKNIAISLIACILSVISACSGDYDPEKEVRIEYEVPLGCNEVSGIITFKASIKGDGAPVAAAVRYELRTDEEGEPIVLIGNAPDYEAEFDTSNIRDGHVYYRAVPLDSNGNKINFQFLSLYSPPAYRGLMVNNGTLDLSKPLIVFGAETEPYSGELTGIWTKEQLQPHMIFAATLMEHLKEAGYIPEMCFGDHTTIVIDPSNPLAEGTLVSDNLVDMLGEPVTGTPVRNNGTLCLSDPFFEIRQPNGIPDIWEHTALDNVKAYTLYGSVKNEPEAFALYSEIGDRLTNSYNVFFDNQSYFGFIKPVRDAEPENLLKQKLQGAITAGATSVLIYDFYVKTNDFEMSAGSWPQYQKTVDELNRELGTSVGVGTITSNASQLMHYDNFLRSLFLGIRDTVKTSEIPPDKKLGIIMVEHGIGRTGRLYDVLRISTPVFNKRLNDYFSTRMDALYDKTADIAISYIAGTTSPAENVRTVGEQVAEWVAEGYEYIVIYPAEWFWESRQTYLDLRQSAVEEIDEDNIEIYIRDKQERTEIMIDDTRIIVSETTLTKKTVCPPAYHYLKAASAQHLEDRLISMTNAVEPEELSGAVSIIGGSINLTLPFSDILLAYNGNITLQNAGIKAQGAVSPNYISGTVNEKEMEYFLFALLAENALDVSIVTVSEASLKLEKTDNVFHGNIKAIAKAEIDGRVISLILTIEL